MIYVNIHLTNFVKNTDEAMESGKGEVKEKNIISGKKNNFFCIQNYSIYL